MSNIAKDYNLDLKKHKDKCKNGCEDVSKTISTKIKKEGIDSVLNSELYSNIKKK